MAGRPTDRPAKEELETLFLTQNLTIAAIAAHFSTSRDLVKAWLRYYGISKFPQRRPKTAIKPTDEEIRALWAAHGSIHAVANQLNVSRTAVRRWLVRAGIEPDRKPASRPTGERKVKPTAEQQFVVKERRAPTPPRRIVDAPLPRITRLCELPYPSQLAVQRTVTDFRTWLALRREYV